MTFVRSPRCLAQAMCDCVTNLWSIIDCKHFIFFTLLILESNAFFDFIETLWSTCDLPWVHGFKWHHFLVPDIHQLRHLQQKPGTWPRNSKGCRWNAAMILNQGSLMLMKISCISIIFSIIYRLLAWHGRLPHSKSADLNWGITCDVGCRPWAYNLCLRWRVEEW